MSDKLCTARVYGSYDGPDSPREQCDKPATEILYRVHGGITDTRYPRWFCEIHARAHVRLTFESGVGAEWDGR